MPSQLRLRAIAARGAAARHASPPPLPPERRHCHAAELVASGSVRDAMRSIQASVDALQSQESDTPVDESVRRSTAPENTPAQPSTKRVRTEPAEVGLHLQPANAVVDKRDGRTKIYLNGYQFTRANVTSVKISYRCSFYRSQDCPAKLEFYAAMMDYDFSNMVPHTCTPPSQAPVSLDETTRTLVVKASMQREVDRLATTSAATPQAIWDEVSVQFYDREDNVVVRGLSKAQVTKRVHATRAGHFGSDIHGRVEVPPLSRVKATSLNFFQFHHVWTNPKLNTENKIDRLVGWAHPTLLSLLRYGKISLFVDGTFRCVPNQFRQCVVIMVFDQGTKLYVPVFYVLAASKTFDTYWNILQYVSDACGERVEPQQVVCDFESALIQAVGDWFPETSIVGCFFHFKQACSRKMAKLHIPAAEIKIAMERGVLDMLTVVEQDKIAKQGVAWVRRRLKARCSEEGTLYSAKKWCQFWKYFSKTWIKLLPPRVWNVHGLRRDAAARTNNPLERFNRVLNAAFGTPHPSMLRFVQTIERISRHYVKLRDDIARGIASPPKRDGKADLPAAVTLPNSNDDSSDDDVLSDEDIVHDDIEVGSDGGGAFADVGFDPSYSESDEETGSGSDDDAERGELEESL